MAFLGILILKPPENSVQKTTGNLPKDGYVSKDCLQEHQSLSLGHTSLDSAETHRAFHTFFAFPQHVLGIIKTCTKEGKNLAEF